MSLDVDDALTHSTGGADSSEHLERKFSIGIEISEVIGDNELVFSPRQHVAQTSKSQYSSHSYLSPSSGILQNTHVMGVPTLYEVCTEFP